MEESSAEQSQWMVTQKTECSPPVGLPCFMYLLTTILKSREWGLPVAYALALAFVVFHVIRLSPPFWRRESAIDSAIIHSYIVYSTQHCTQCMKRPTLRG